MFDRVRKIGMAVAALGALALGGSAIAGAANNDNSGATGSGSSSASPPAQGQPPSGRHVGANGKREQALSADVAAKVEGAALAKVKGGTIDPHRDRRRPRLALRGARPQVRRHRGRGSGQREASRSRP